ncbi:hypothetical protein HMPREF9413_5272 [Paenibacillus sp. HGF7]|nr:hypothetical protein HMPREF9413_5272 [Paenibacillus sp. HGF7]
MLGIWQRRKIAATKRTPGNGPEPQGFKTSKAKAVPASGSGTAWSGRV